MIVISSGHYVCRDVISLLNLGNLDGEMELNRTESGDLTIDVYNGLENETGWYYLIPKAINIQDSGKAEHCLPNYSMATAVPWNMISRTR